MQDSLDPRPVWMVDGLVQQLVTNFDRDLYSQYMSCAEVIRLGSFDGDTWEAVSLTGDIPVCGHTLVRQCDKIFTHEACIPVYMPRYTYYIVSHGI